MINGELQYNLEGTEFPRNTSSYRFQVKCNDGFISKVSIIQPLPPNTFLVTPIFILVAILASFGILKKGSYIATKLVSLGYWGKRNFQPIVFISTLFFSILFLFPILPDFTSFLTPNSEFKPISQSLDKYSGTLDISFNLTSSDSGYGIFWNHPITYTFKPELGKATTIGSFGSLPSTQSNWGDEHTSITESSGIELIVTILGSHLTSEAYPFDNYLLLLSFEVANSTFFSDNNFNVNISIFDTILAL